MANQPTTHPFLTEQRVKEIALSFLKKHYLDYYANELDLSKGEEAALRDPGLVARLDQMLPGDIIVDGEIRFLRKDGTPFVATFEATDRAHAGELFYRFQKWLLLWDGLATASMVVLTVMAISYAFDILPFDRWGWGLSALVVAGEIGLLTLLYILIMRGRSRYRYIYAIEQFKRYHADEHWVAFAEDVFGGETDPRYRELKVQAVREGIGLLEITTAGRPRLLFLPRRITPAIAHHQKAQANKRMARMERTFRQISDALYRRWPWKPGPTSYLRFRKSYFKQMGITLFALVGMAYIMSHTIIHKPPRKASKKELEELARQKEPPEPPDYMVDTPFIARPFPEREVPESEPAASAAGQYLPDTVFLNNQDRVAFSDCARFANITGTVWLVTDDWFDSLDEATRQLEYWAGEGQPASLLWAGCLEGYEPRAFLVFLGGIFPDEAQAQKEAARIEAWYADLQPAGQARVFDLLSVRFVH